MLYVSVKNAWHRICTVSSFCSSVITRAYRVASFAYDRLVRVVIICGRVGLFFIFHISTQQIIKTIKWNFENQLYASFYFRGNISQMYSWFSKKRKIVFRMLTLLFKYVLFSGHPGLDINVGEFLDNIQLNNLKEIFEKEEVRKNSVE